VSERISGYHEAWKIFKKHPVLGVGAGNYTAAAYQLNPARPGWEYQPVHNVFILFVVEEGGVGFLLSLILLSLVFKSKIPKRDVAPSGLYVQISKSKQNPKSKFQINCKIQTHLISRKFPYFLFLISYFPLFIFDHYLYSSYVGLMLVAIFFGLIARWKLSNPQLIDS